MTYGLKRNLLLLPLFAPFLLSACASQSQLDKAVAENQQFRTQNEKLLVTGYTDNAPVGAGLQAQGITSNEVLSQKRADTVMQYMISQGVKPDLIAARGFGDADPVVPNTNAQSRAQNRRVEITLAGPAS